MAFLDKLKVKMEDPTPVTEEKKDNKKSTTFLQLDVDIYQTASEIVIVAPIPGVDISEIDISVENENDVVTIQGRRQLVEDMLSEQTTMDRKYLARECQWGSFYRQIILPQEVNVAEVEAKFKKGILTLRLPLLRLQSSGRKKILVNNVAETTAQ